MYDYCRINVFIGILLIELCIFFCKACFILFFINYVCIFGGKFIVDYELFVMGIKEFCLMFDRMKKINILLFFYKVNFVMKMMIIV